MTVTTLAGRPVTVDDDGFLADPADWTPEIAEELAAQAGIDLTDRHWQVIEFCRKDAEEQDGAPTVRRITRMTDVSMKEMYQLFPGGPGILAARIAGLAKPKGCI